MLQKNHSDTVKTTTTPDSDLVRLRFAGRQVAKSLGLVDTPRSACAQMKRKYQESVRTISDVLHGRARAVADARWLFDNHRLIRTANKDIRDLAESLLESRSAKRSGSTTPEPLPYVISAAYLGAALDFVSTEGLAAFVEGFQQEHVLSMGELWALEPALEMALVERVALATKTRAVSLAVLMTSLRTISELDWKDFFESASVVNGILAQDPSGHYSRMDYASRDQYRDVVGKLAENSDLSEAEIAETAVELASAAKTPRETHVGYWLLDEGLPALRSMIGYKPSLIQRLRNFVLAWSTPYYLVGIELLTLAIAFIILEGRGELTPTLFALALLLLPATQAAVDFMNNLTSYLLRPRVLPKLDFSEGIPRDCATLVAVPTLLLNEKQVRQLVIDLEIRYLANRDENLYFALVTDGPDSDRAEDERDRLVDVCAGLINDLNARYGSERPNEATGEVEEHRPFFLFHRHRKYNPSEGRWMGWERKRGKLLDLNQLMRGGEDSFPIKIGDLSVLPKIKYVLTLDSDTQLPRDAAHRLVGAIAHPLHRAVVDPATRMVVAGYGILQPRIGISVDSASSSRLASLYSGQTGFDIYTRAISDVYQDLFGEGIFTGKGIYDVDALREAIEHRFPENALLSHDLIEGAYARVGLVSDIELIDDYPSHFSAYSRRKHRWVRGDWQIMRWILPRVPDVEGNIIPNPISLISQWKIFDNLRRSLFEPATMALLLAGWFVLPTEPRYWTCASVAMVLMPVYANLLFSLLRVPNRSSAVAPWLKDTAVAFVKGHMVAFLQIVFLLHQTMLAVDAIARSVLRVFVTKKRLLEWETAAEAETAQRRKSTVDVYLAWSPLLAVALTTLLWVARPQALPIAAPILALWFLARFLSAWLNRAPRTMRGHLDQNDVQFLRASALRTWRYFREHSNPDTNWLIPDNVREDGRVAERLSPTNLGMLLNARIAAVHFGYLSVPDFAETTQATLDQLQKLEVYRGQVLNWYATDTLQPLEPRFVSTVDNGNLAACLWTLKQAALTFAANPPSADVMKAGLADLQAQAAEELETGSAGFWSAELAEQTRRMSLWAQTGLTDDLKHQLLSIAKQCDRLVKAMDFSFLFQKRRKVMSVGCDVSTGMVETSAYDLLASESRIANFVAIAKGDIPQEGWFRLSRKHVLSGGERLLISWTGTMFEYLMPTLWMKHYRDTILHESVHAAVRVQKKFARRKRLPWGISESGCAAGPDGEYGYYAFGIPEIAMGPCDPNCKVVSPYSTFLALPIEPRAAVKNLRRMAKLGWFGKFGFYESTDYRGQKPEVIRSWMAHHQGMSLLALCNLLFADKMQEYFHAEPQVLATELLLHERIPKSVVVEAEQAVLPSLVLEPSA